MRATSVNFLRFLLLLCLATPALALMEIEVIGGAANKIAIAMLPLHGTANQPTPSLTQIAGDDLTRRAPA